LIADAVDDLDDQPPVQAQLRELLAHVHFSRSRFEQARIDLDQALAYHETAPYDPVAVARIRHTVASLTLETEGREAAVPLFRASLARHRELFGDDHPDVGIALQDLAGALLEADPDESFTLLEQAKPLAEAYPEQRPMAMAALYNRMGALMLDRAELEKARTSFEQALAMMRQPLGADHPHVLTVEHNLATSLGVCGRWTEAEVILRRGLETRQRVLGPDNLQVARSWEALSGVLAQQGRSAEALAGYAEAIRIFDATLGPDSGPLSSVLRNIATIYVVQDQPGLALDHIDRALAIDRAGGEPDGRMIMHKRGVRATALYLSGRTEAALSEARTTLAAATELATGPTDRYVADLQVVLATLLMAVDHFDETVPLLRAAVATRTARTVDDHPSLARDRSLLAVALIRSGQAREGRQLLRKHHVRARDWHLMNRLQRKLIATAVAEAGFSSR
jgi:tetratricopeptide (TPR) repeat protein